MKKFASHILNAADLRQQSGRKGSLTLRFQCGTTSGSNQEGRGVLLSNFNVSQLAAAGSLRVKLFLIRHYFQS